MIRIMSDTRQKLVETATELIWSESYGSVSVDEICTKAGVQKGSFYHFFPSKSDLALETVKWCQDSMKARYDDIFSVTRPPVERFELLALYLYEKQAEIKEQLGHVCGCPLVTLGSEFAGKDDEISVKIKDICSRSLSYYESALRDLVAEGVVTKDMDIKVKAEEIYAFIIGNMVMARIKNDLSFIRDHFKNSLFGIIGIQEYKREPIKLTG